MSLFTPRNQVRDMLDAQIGQALCGRGDLTKITALSSLMGPANQNNSLFVEDNWLDDDDLWD